MVKNMRTRDKRKETRTRDKKKETRTRDKRRETRAGDKRRETRTGGAGKGSGGKEALLKVGEKGYGVKEERPKDAEKGEGRKGKRSKVGEKGEGRKEKRSKVGVKGNGVKGNGVKETRPKDGGKGAGRCIEEYLQSSDTRTVQELTEGRDIATRRATVGIIGLTGLKGGSEAVIVTRPETVFAAAATTMAIAGIIGPTDLKEGSEAVVATRPETVVAAAATTRAFGGTTGELVAVTDTEGKKQGATDGHCQPYPLHGGQLLFEEEESHQRYRDASSCIPERVHHAHVGPPIQEHEVYECHDGIADDPHGHP